MSASPHTSFHIFSHSLRPSLKNYTWCHLLLSLLLSLYLLDSLPLPLPRSAQRFYICHKFRAQLVLFPRDGLQGWGCRNWPRLGSNPGTTGLALELYSLSYHILRHLTFLSGSWILAMLFLSAIFYFSLQSYSLQSTIHRSKIRNTILIYLLFPILAGSGIIIPDPTDPESSTLFLRIAT